MSFGPTRAASGSECRAAGVPAARRSVLVHYHLFKNAGSSIDAMLRANFGERLAVLEGPQAWSRIHPPQLAEFIMAHPSLCAVTSHHACLPPPAIPGVSVVPILLLRHPLERVGSVYRFERRQPPVSPGAVFAAGHDFADYVRWRLDREAHGMIHNFHMQSLSRDAQGRARSPGPEAVDRAVEWLGRLPWFGIVEQYRRSVERLARRVRPRFPGFRPVIVHANLSPQRQPTLEQRIAAIREALGEPLFEELRSRNKLDLALYRCATALFEQMETDEDRA